METRSHLGFGILRPFSEYSKVLDWVLAQTERTTQLRPTTASAVA